MPLDLAAGGFRNAFDGHHLCDFESGVFIDEPSHGGGRRQEIAQVAAMEHEHHEFLALGAGFGDAGRHDFVEIEAGCTLCDVLEVVGVVVQAVDEDDFLAASGNVEIALVHEAEIAGVEAAGDIDGGGGSCGIAEITLCDTLAGNQNVPHVAVGQRVTLGISDGHFDTGDGATDAHEFDHVA